MNVPFVDLKTQYKAIKDDVLLEINDVLDNTAYICGSKAKKFEEDFARMHGAKHCVAMSSGTDALHTALKACGISHGDEVIVPVNTFIATSETVSLCGARPVFVDHDERTFNIDTDRIESAITKDTKAIIPVHLYGQPADMESIMEIARKHNLYVIEDCSQAHLASYRNTRVGTFGHAGTFSFYPGKNLGAYGEGGAVVTNNRELFEKILRFRQHGSINKYVHETEGHNYRMEEIQAGVLNVKMKHIEKWTKARRSIAENYNNNLGIIDNGQLIIPYCPGDFYAVYHLYVVRAKKRDKLMEYLNEKGVQTGLHYPTPLHLQKAYGYLNYKKGDFPVSEKCCDEILSLPMFPELTSEQTEYVCDSVKSFFSKN